MSAISSQDVINQLLEIERELIELESKFAESFETRERAFFEATQYKVQEIENDLNRIQYSFNEIEKTRIAEDDRNEYRKLDLEPQFQV